jgi:hypothetical protein
LCTVRKQDAAGVETALDRLRKRAMSLFNIPSSYRLMIEDGERLEEAGSIPSRDGDHQKRRHLVSLSPGGAGFAAAAVWLPR